MKKAFTLIELLVVVAIIVILSGVVMFAAGQYIKKGKDSAVSGNLVPLIAAGEVYYNANGDYSGFCDLTGGGVSVLVNALSQMPDNRDGSCYSSSSASTKKGVCCTVGTVITNNDAWVACARKFADPTKAFCVDSRGVSREIDKDDCTSSMNPPECPQLLE